MKSFELCGILAGTKVSSSQDIDNLMRKCAPLQASYLYTQIVIIVSKSLDRSRIKPKDKVHGMKYFSQKFLCLPRTMLIYCLLTTPAALFDWSGDSWPRKDKCGMDRIPMCSILLPSPITKIIQSVDRSKNANNTLFEVKS